MTIDFSNLSVCNVKSSSDFWKCAFISFKEIVHLGNIFLKSGNCLYIIFSYPMPAPPSDTNLGLFLELKIPRKYSPSFLNKIAPFACSLFLSHPLARLELLKLSLNFSVEYTLRVEKFRTLLYRGTVSFISSRIASKYSSKTGSVSSILSWLKYSKNLYKPNIESIMCFILALSSSVSIFPGKDSANPAR